MLVEDEDFDAAIITELFERRTERGYAVTRACSLKEAKVVITNSEFDIIFCDMGLPDSTGLTTVREILGATTTVPVVVLTGNEDTDVALQAMRLGAQDYLPKTQVNNKVLERITEYSMHRKTISPSANDEQLTDRLTGLINKTALFARWDRINARAMRDHVNIGVLMVDINKFSLINSTYGHEVGDALLLHIADELESSVLTTDLIARLNDDKFVVVLENLKTQKDVNSIRDKLQLLLSDTFDFAAQRINYSVAVGGVLCDPSQNRELADVLKDAGDRIAKQKIKLRN